VREEVEGLEHHADVGAQVGKRLALLGQLLAVDGDRAGLVGLEPVDRAAQRRLPRPGGADEDDDLALADGEVDVLEDVERSEVFVDPLMTTIGSLVDAAASGGSSPSAGRPVGFWSRAASVIRST
jgi:hypothetical protein